MNAGSAANAGNSLKANTPADAGAAVSASTPADAHAAANASCAVDGAATIARLTARIEQLESQFAIRSVMTDYMRRCDQLDAGTAMNELGELFTADAVWTGKGKRYGAAFGSHHGRAAILAMLDSYRLPPHFAFNAHFLTSENIVVTDDTATGHWMMLQTSTYSTGLSDLRSAHLSVEFVRDAVRWRISRFTTENLFSRPIDRWDDPAPVPLPAGGS